MPTITSVNGGSALNLRDKNISCVGTDFGTTQGKLYISTSSTLAGVSTLAQQRIISWTDTEIVFDHLEGELGTNVGGSDRTVYVYVEEADGTTNSSGFSFTMTAPSALSVSSGTTLTGVGTIADAAALLTDLVATGDDLYTLQNNINVTIDGDNSVLFIDDGLVYMEDGTRLTFENGGTIVCGVWDATLEATDRGVAIRLPQLLPGFSFNTGRIGNNGGGDGGSLEVYGSLFSATDGGSDVNTPLIMGNGSVSDRFWVAIDSIYVGDNGTTNAGTWYAPNVYLDNVRFIGQVDGIETTGDVRFLNNVTVRRFGTTGFKAFSSDATVRGVVFDSTSDKHFEVDNGAELSIIDCVIDPGEMDINDGTLNEQYSLNATYESGGVGQEDLNALVIDTSGTNSGTGTTGSDGVLPEIILTAYVHTEPPDGNSEADYAARNGTTNSPFTYRARRYDLVWQELELIPDLEEAAPTALVGNQNTVDDVTQTEATALAHTGITVEDLTTPFTLDGNDYTIKVTGDLSVNSSLTAVDIYHYLRASLASLTGFSGRTTGLNWPEFITSSGGSISTLQVDDDGTLKGAIVVDENDAAFAGFTSFTADDGTVVNAPVTVQITVVDSDGNAIENARVLLEQDSDGTDIIDALTNSSGQVTTTFDYVSDTAVSGRVRKGSTSPFFKTAPISGTITSAGLSINVQMVSDE